MRWLFFILVALNVLFYVYQVTNPTKQPRPVINQERTTDRGTIKLLSETSAPARKSDLSAGDSCLFLGGFDEEGIATALEQRLLSLDIDSVVHPLDMQAGVDYWVYLPPLVSRQASLRQLRELQSRNIDSYVITVGDLANGVSLGIFSRKDSAESVVSRLQALDYAASIRELPRAHRRYWVKVAQKGQRLLSNHMLQNLARDFPALESQQMPCSSVATLE
ncbi:SPOR domain-containing protein [Stutzerimonas chloritidismutans]|uniref:SPOR domain-containing protein n=1 Tax=Stutzerimonas chloritidismutans TaxID=203192 RepID=UPI003F157915